MVDRHGHRHGTGAKAGPIVLTKSLDESIPSGGSQQDDDDLYFTGVAGGLYSFEALLLVSSSVNANFIYEWVEPSGATFQIQATTPTETLNLTETYGERLVAIVANVITIIRFIGTIQVGPVGGIFRLRWR